MKALSSCTSSFIGLACLLVGAPAVVACGPTQFRDSAAINISGALPPPPKVAVKAPARVEVRDNHIEIREKIQFAYNDDKILEVSFSLLDEIAGVIKKNPHVKKIEIGGHASTEGDDAHNLDLSDRRAKAVMKHLLEKGGVETERLVAKGFGETKPLVTPDESEADREKNRRVEFAIVLQDVTKKRVEIDAATGSEKIVETSTATLDQGK